jgi:putative DNA methylase
VPAFIETQFPIARLSAESYKERKANNGQTLTRLGKWWGRKPLILVRASIVGMLMPASDDPKRDREIFLKILTMDDAGTWDRCKPAVQRKTDRVAFDALPYAERISFCERPENVAGPTAAAWAEINAHLGTTATRLSELIEQLGQRTFGHSPRVGDAFCGGGSIPFEAARIGCTAFGSDLNPVACLLTWASLNLLGGGPAVQQEVMRVQAEALREADRQVTAWGIEHNEHGERADAYLYCVEVKPEGSDYYIPLAPSWLVGEKSCVVCRWHRQDGSDRLRPEIVTVTTAEVAAYKAGKGATARDGRVIDPFNPERTWSIESLRGPEGLRLWSDDDLVPRPGDVFQERLYCIRWVKTVIRAEGTEEETRRYAAPDAGDVRRERRTLDLLRERFVEWQYRGFIPSRRIPLDGEKTDEPVRTRGWTNWHHLFTPRQLLIQGLTAETSTRFSTNDVESVACLLGLGRMADWNARLSAWMYHAGNEKGNQVFYNQALNCHSNYAARALPKLVETFCILSSIGEYGDKFDATVELVDARDLRHICDLWITDPPYADAISYHELGDFFLSWYEKQLAHVFPSWTADSRSELAVRGDGDAFRRAMVDIYKNLTRHMPDNGMQMVMFTHQDPSVWADLGMILWAAGLKATAAWTISTETDAVGIKKGSYVQGTVCLVLRKRTSAAAGFLDEIFPLVEDEVKRQIDSMQALDEGGEPNFNDADYQLAAYAAALKVLTQYGAIDGRDVEHEVFAVREHGKKSDFQAVIERALGIACDYLIPRGLDAAWRELSLVERYYLRALDIESRGERRKGMYEELARGFGVTDIKPLLKADKANGATVHTPSGLEAGLLATPSGASPAGDLAPVRRGRGRSGTGAPHPFASSALRHLLFAIRETVAADHNPEPGRQYLRDTYGPGIYWQHRERFLVLLEWLSGLGNAAGMEGWTSDSEAARLLAGRLRNDEA